MASRLSPERGASVIGHLADLVHLAQHAGERGDLPGHLVGHVHQGAELLRARLHHHIGHDDGVLVILVAADQLFQIGKALGRRLAREAGGLGDVAAGTAAVDRPVREDGEEDAGDDDRGGRNQEDIAFLGFHVNEGLTGSLTFCFWYKDRAPVAMSRQNGAINA